MQNHVILNCILNTNSATYRVNFRNYECVYNVNSYQTIHLKCKIMF